MLSTFDIIIKKIIENALFIFEKNFIVKQI